MSCINRCTTELDLNIFVFLTTKSNKESMYCECRGRMFNFFNNSQKESLFPAFIVILITVFCNLKMVLL